MVELNNVSSKKEQSIRPLILAPAGGKDAFLAAMAAGADAIYCGLKAFSARMAAHNFTMEELAALSWLAHDRKTKVYVAFNSLVKPDELAKAGQLLKRLARDVQVDALIVQDLGMIALAKQIGFHGEIHLSTLANVTFAADFSYLQQKLGVNRVVLPRELTVDEIKTVAAQCPDGFGLEVFVHGALCYAVSGRCYWSSYLGGKSGLRGRCVQPCRRKFKQNKRSKRFFSCQDLSADVLVKILKTIPQVKAWKIEGRKKGPHYVYYTVKAYQILRDEGRDPKAKKQALALLERALGRRGTHYHFLSQRMQNPIPANGQTASGLLVGKVQGGSTTPYLSPREALLVGDILRLGYEDDKAHLIQRVTKSVPKKGRLYLKPSKKRAPIQGLSVFLIDRREPLLEKELNGLNEALARRSSSKTSQASFHLSWPQKKLRSKPVEEYTVWRRLPPKRSGLIQGVWLTAETRIEQVQVRHKLWWWLPPVIWPQDHARLENKIGNILSKGEKKFVLNAPWQVFFFTADRRNSRGLQLWAGPFSNIVNPLALSVVASMGFSGAFVSPELGERDVLSMPSRSPLPLGIVLTGHWPLCISRTTSDDLQLNKSFTSPKGEAAWVSCYGPDYWLFPNWKLDIFAKKYKLKSAGYTHMVHLQEPVPRGVTLKDRPGLWNWAIDLK